MLNQHLLVPNKAVQDAPILNRCDFLQQFLIDVFGRTNRRRMHSRRTSLRLSALGNFTGIASLAIRNKKEWIFSNNGVIPIKVGGLPLFWEKHGMQARRAASILVPPPDGFSFLMLFCKD
jgi:hypothetical protein